jgi:CTP synthase
MITKAGLKASGVNPDTGLVEIVEIEDHPFHWRNTIQNIKYGCKPTSLFCEFCSCCRKSKKKK